MSVATLVPYAGSAFALMLLPAATLGLMAATLEASKGKFPMPAILISAFRAGRQQMRGSQGQYLHQQVLAFHERPRGSLVREHIRPGPECCAERRICPTNVAEGRLRPRPASAGSMRSRVWRNRIATIVIR